MKMKRKILQDVKVKVPGGKIYRGDEIPLTDVDDSALLDCRMNENKPIVVVIEDPKPFTRYIIECNPKASYLYEEKFGNAN